MIISLYLDRCNHPVCSGALSQSAPVFPLTDEEFVNAVFEPQEQVSETQAQLLDATFILASSGPAQVHVGTGGGGSQSDIPWGEKKKSSEIKR